MIAGFVSSTTFLGAVRQDALALGHRACSSARPARNVSVRMADGGGGVFGKMFEGIQAKLVKTPGVKNSEVEKCPFCERGRSDCSACKGSGKDALGTCLMCDGKKAVVCSVCSGVGKVDSVRRGGTDLGGEYLGKRGKRSSSKTLVWTCDATGAICGCNQKEGSRLPLVYDGSGPMTEQLPDNKVIFACACGQSTMWPFCSGMHKAVNAKNGTTFKPFEIESTTAKDVQLCRCGHSESRPYCDGTHTMIQQTSG